MSNSQKSEQESSLQQDEINRVEAMLTHLNKEGIEDIDQYIDDIRNRETQETQRLSVQLRLIKEGRLIWLRKLGVILFWYLRPLLFHIGQTTRSYFRFLLGVLAASWGVIIESFSAVTWRRTVRYEFKRSLGQVVSGGFFSTFFTATLAGLAVVSQAIFWLGATGLTKMTGPILVTILVREVAPILVGMILLGRNGILTVTECSLLAMNGQLRSLTTLGIDPFVAIVLPRVWAFTIGSFTLGMVFGTTSLFMGYVVTYALGTMQDSIWMFYSNILASMLPTDYIFVPLKFVVMGFMIAVGSCITGMNVKVDDEPSTLLPKGFTRGIMLIMVVNILFSIGF